ncbi:MAG: hypothetical protein ACKOEQ_07915, partial [Verrucomicrobiota bacterium]
AADVGGFVSLSGNVGFKKVGTDIVAVGTQVNATLSAGATASVSVTGATLGLKTANGATVLEVRDGAFAAQVAGLASVTATAVRVQYSNAGGSAAQGETLTVGGTSYAFGTDIAAGTVVFEATGLAADVGGFVSVSGNVGFRKVSAEIVAVGTQVNATMSVGATASVSLTGASLGLVTGATGSALEVKDGVFVASLTGLAEVTAESVRLRYAGEGRGIAAGTSVSVGGIAYAFNDGVGAGVASLEIRGLVASLGDFVRLQGDFGLRKQGLTVRLADGTDVAARALTLGGTGIQAFLGFNAGTSGAVGLQLSDAAVGLALVVEASGAGRLWTTLQARVGQALVVGVEGLGIGVRNLELEYNRSGDGGPVIDYDGATELRVPTGVGTFIQPGMDGGLGELTRAVGRLDIDALGFVRLEGTFGIEQRSAGVVLSDGSTVATDLLLVGGGGMTAFVGSNAGTASAVGLRLEGVDAGLAVVSERSPGAGTSGRRWTSVQASVGSIEMQGVSEVGLVGTRFAMEANRASADGLVVDYGAGRTALSIRTGGATSMNLAMDGSLGALLRLRGHGSLGIAGVVFGEGEIEVERRAVEGVADPDSASGGILKGSLMTIRVSDARLFVGSGATLVLDRASPDFGKVVLPASDDVHAVGFAVSGGQFVLGLFSATHQSGDQGRTWNDLGPVGTYTGIRASLGRARLQGVSAVEMLSPGLGLSLNRTSRAGGKVLDWTGGALASAGIVLRPADPVLEVGGTVGLALGGVVLASATVRMSQSVVEEVRNPNVGEANVRMRGSLLALELADARVFVGSGGELV